MKFKAQYVDCIIKCPFTNKMVNTFFVDPELYKYYINRGFGYMFEETENSIEDNDISEQINDQSSCSNS